MKTGNKICIDTNAYSNLLKGDESLLKIFSNATEIYVPIFVIAELLSGFKKGSREEKNISILERFLNKPQVFILNTQHETAKVYAKLKYDLRIIGKPIPENDIWIAAIAIQEELSLLTLDKHFKHIKNLVLEMPLIPISY